MSWLQSSWLGRLAKVVRRLCDHISVRGRWLWNHISVSKKLKIAVSITGRST